MNKKELVEKVAERTAMTKKDTELVINALTDCIKETLAAGGKVQIAGFGTFEAREKSKNGPKSKKA